MNAVRESYIGASNGHRAGSGKDTPAASQRILPHSAEAEQCILGSMLLSPRDAIIEAMANLTIEHFYIPAHHTVYLELLAMFEANQAIDLMTLTQWMRDRGRLETVGGASFLTSLFTFVPTSANLGYYIEIVRDKYVLREIISACTEGVRRAFEDQSEVKQLVDDIQAKVTAVALDQAQESPVKHVQSALEEVIDEIINAHKKRGRTTGLATGFADLDRSTLGMSDGDMIVIGGRPSMGKTSFALQIAQNVALDHREAGREIKGAPVLVFSMETGAKRLMFRAVCSRSKSNIQELRRGFIAAPEKETLERIQNVAAELASAPIYIDDSPALQIFEFKARARYAVAQLGIKLIVIDYLQLMKSPSKRAEFSKTLEITEVSAAIKEIARSLNVPVIALAQLNREVENRAKSRPRLVNLRESGQIEQDADLILFLHREDYYLPEGSKERAAAEGVAEVIIAKQKDGPTATIKVGFLKEYARFESLTKKLYSNNPEEQQQMEAGL